MSTRDKPSLSLAKAQELLRGSAAPVLDVDWVGVDAHGRVAFFLGEEKTLPPRGADVRSANELLERIASREGASTRATAEDGGYRSAAARTSEPIFDPPRRGVDEPLHETPLTGYPQLVVASPGEERIVRDIMNEYGGREVLARGAFAASIDVLGPITNEELHAGGACAGCRGLELRDDPRTRSCEVLASHGFYVFWGARGVWLRAASPSRVETGSHLNELGLRAALAVEADFEGSLVIETSHIGGERGT